MRDFSAKPFYLTQEQQKWVRDTYDNMNEEQRIGQLFCHIAYTNDEENLQDILDTLQPAAVMLRPMSLESTISAASYLQRNAKIPLLLAANLEKGPSGAVETATNYASPMEIGATSDPEMAWRLGEICGAEASACGLNWSFAPIIDIDNNFRNPITNTRTFGSNYQHVRDMGVAYVNAVQNHGMAASIKHFPGDGCDERDQHLVTSINDLSCEEWDATYGEVYKASIEAGAKTVMVGHIMQPAYEKHFNPGLPDKDMQPGTLSYNLLNKLLREKLGFNGLIVSDATTMAGFITNMPREQAVPGSIAAGCDMFLFCRNMREDLEYMKQGVQKGIITPERLEEAVCTVLALKASLNLPEKQKTGMLVPAIDKAREVVGCEKHRLWAVECADKAVTLVKEEPGVLPISPDKTKRVLLYPIESDPGFIYSVQSGVCTSFKELLEQEGFDVTTYIPQKGFEGMLSSQKEYLDKYDIMIYIANMATKSNQTTVRIEWAQPMGANVPAFIKQIPTVWVSVENPYHLLDVPRVRTFINAYHSTPEVLQAVIDKLCGRSEFKGISPVDAFCGKWDTHL